MLEAAISLMRASGLSGAGINEIVRESGAPKGSVYHFFPQGKLQLVADALAVYGGRVEAFIDVAMAGRSSPPEKVRALFEAFAARAAAGDFERSCAAGATSLDLTPSVAALQPMLARMFDDWASAIARHLEPLDGERAGSFAGLLLTAIEGAYVRSRAERSARAFLEAGEWLALLATNLDADRAG